MLDVSIRKFCDPIAEKVGSVFFKQASPMFLTFMGLVFAICGMFFMVQSFYFFALIMIVFNRICDGLDGTVSRIRGLVSDRGAYFDILFDMIFYCGTVFAFIYPYSHFHLLGALTLFSMMMTGMSFLAFGLFAHKYEGLETQEKKSFFFHNGLVEGTETTLFLILICIFTNQFWIISTIFICACWITTLMRFRLAWKFL